MSRPLAELLLKEKLLNGPQFEEAIAHAEKEKMDPVKWLILNGKISENKLSQYLAKRFSLQTINLTKFEIEKKVLDTVAPNLVFEHQVIPVQIKDQILVVAVCDPTVLANVDKIKFVTRKQIESVLTTYSAFEETLTKYYGTSAGVNSKGLMTALTQMKKREGGKTRTEAGKVGSETSTFAVEQVIVHDLDDHTVDAAESSGQAVVAFVNSILGEAIRRGASDVHVEAYEKRFRVRLRIDGSLHELAEVPAEIRRAVIARLKIMSRMDIAENRVPQDGRIKLKTSGREVDFRVSTLPTLYGEKVVLRLLSQGNLQLDLKKLGFEDEQLKAFRKGIYAANGMVLVTGPTGSGKTTTLYSALAELNLVSDNISTVEDPVEYNLEGVNQTQINKDVGLTFAAVLRSLLRQDPDTILVGEIRDFETAEVSIQAALTGHLVLSTLHTNDAPSTLTRLMNMGVEPFLVTASVNTIVAQRLLRKLCTKCRYEVTIPEEMFEKLEFPLEELQSAKFFEGKGCASCGSTGYKGRIAIYEVLDFTQDLKEMLLRGDTVLEIKRKAVANGMKSLRHSAILRAIAGGTSLKEALALTME